MATTGSCELIPFGVSEHVGRCARRCQRLKHPTNQIASKKSSVLGLWCHEGVEVALRCYRRWRPSCCCEATRYEHGTELTTHGDVASRRLAVGRRRRDQICRFG